MKRLAFIGIGGAINLELGGTSCFIKENGSLLVINACEGATKKLLEARAFDGINNVYIAITHTHFDHIAGLGVLIWYCRIQLKITPHIIFENEAHRQTLGELFRLTGIRNNQCNFIPEDSLGFSFSVEMTPTSHSSDLQCYGIMFEDESGKYYYSGDTSDIEQIRNLCDNPAVRAIYCEVSPNLDEHISYDDIQELDKSKLILMHFTNMDIYNRAIADGFTVAAVAEGVKI